MINPNKVVKNFEENFKKMSYDEREAYLKEMGFSFGAPMRTGKTFATTKVARSTGRPRSRALYVASSGVEIKNKKNGSGAIRVGNYAYKSKV